MANQRILLTRYTLGDLLDVTRGMSLPGSNYATSGELIRLTLGNFDYNGNGFKENTSKENIYYSGVVPNEYIMKAGDIITPLTEQTPGLLGTTARIPVSGKYIQSQDVALITCKPGKLDPLFCYYLVSSSIVKQQLAAGSQQTKIRHTSPDKVKDCVVFIPDDLKVQHEIGEFLNTIDEKISLNRKAATELSSITREIYDYWFTQFDFPNDEGKPYKSSGGEMVWNDDIRRVLPKGWQSITFGDCIESINTGLNPRNNFKLNTGGKIRYLTVKNLTRDGSINFATCDHIDESARTLVHRRSDVKEGDILFASISPLGRCHLISEKPTDWDINESIFSIRPKKEVMPSSYLFLTFTSESFVKKAEGCSAGSVFKGIRIAEIQALKTILPPSSVLEEFDRQVSEQMKLTNNLYSEIRQLSFLREFLFPLFMTGQLSIS